MLCVLRPMLMVAPRDGPGTVENERLNSSVEHSEGNLFYNRDHDFAALG